MVKYAKVIGVTLSFALLGSAAYGGTVKKPKFKGSSSFTVNEEQTLSASAAASPGYKGQAIGYTLLSGPSGMTINDSTGQLSWTPTHDQTSNPYQSYAVSVKAYDLAHVDSYATKSLSIKVKQVNTKPTVTCATNVSISEGEQLLLQASGADPDKGQSLKYTLTGAPKGASVKSTSGLISWTTKTGSAGTYTFNVVATDNGLPKLSSSATVTVNVTGINHAPVLASIANKTATAGSELSFTASATDQDAGQTIAYSLSNAPDGASINSSTGKFSWVPTSDQANTSAYSFTVRASDNGSPQLYSEKTVNVTMQTTSDTQTVGFASKAGPLDNPLKGWAPNTTGSTSSLLFTYVSWSDLEPSDGSYNFSAVDKYLNKSTDAGKHIVFRVYLDYPGSTSGVPQWLLESGVAATTYVDVEAGRTGLCPDYNNPTLVSKVTRLIAKLGERYNADPRIAFIQIGIFGQYGEWTTYLAGNTLRFSLETQRTILGAYLQAFPSKKLEGRFPGIDGAQACVTVGGNFNIGFHDDMFPFQTYSVMMPGIIQKSKQSAWMSQPMGGELWPRREDLMLSDAYRDLAVSTTNAYCFSSASQPFSQSCVGTRWRVVAKNGFAGQDIKIVAVDENGVATADKPLGNLGSTSGQMLYLDETATPWNSVYEMSLDRIKAFHATYMRMLPGYVTGTRANTQAKLDAMARLMGYQYRLTSMTLPKSLALGKDNTVVLNLVNEGVAPFYYDWDVTIALMDGDIVKQTINVPWDIRSWMPGAITQSFVVNPTIAAGTYDLAIRIKDPWNYANKPGIEFANALRFDVNGWTHLGSVTVK